MSKRIQCPACGQRFNVGPELYGKMVECGACDHRFEVTDDVEVNPSNKQFPPGRSLRREHEEGEVPLARAQTAGSLRPTHKAPEIHYQSPLKPVQILAGIGAIGLTLAVWLVFIYGSRFGGALQDVTVEQRYLLAGAFGGLILFVFIMAFKHKKPLGAVIGVIFGGSLLAAPSIFPVHTTPVAERTIEELGDELLKTDFQVAVPLDSERPLVERVGRPPIERAESTFGRGKAIGLLVNGMDDTMIDQISRYLTKKFTPGNPPSVFNRDPSQLFVLAPVEMSFDDFLEEIVAIGRVQTVDEEKRLLDFAIRRNLFELPPEGQLESPTAPEFYRLNAEELRALDTERVRKAAVRLTKVPPVQMRRDVRNRLIERINSETSESDIWFLELAECLSKWADDDEAVAAVENAIRKGGASHPLFDREMLLFLLENGSELGRESLQARWQDNPSNWEGIYTDMIKAGNAWCKPHLVETLKHGTIPQKRSAAKLLSFMVDGEVLEILQQQAQLLNEDGDIELRVQIGRSINFLKEKLPAAEPLNELENDPDGVDDLPALPDPN